MKKCGAIIALIATIIPDVVFAADYPRLPITTDWYLLAGSPDPEKTQWRKYSFLPDTQDNPLRNTMILNCSNGGDFVSYLTVIIPKELALEPILGAFHITSRAFYVVSSDSEGIRKENELVAEVKGQELYFDFSGPQRAALRDIILANSNVFHFDGKRMPFEFSEMSDTKDANGNFDLDTMLRDSLDGNGHYSRRMLGEMAFRDCADLQQWNLKR